MLHQIKSEEIGPLGPAMAEAVSKCVHCGFCLAACPTYKHLGQEADSPRGRIVLMKEVLEGTLPLQQALSHIDPCLGCLACEPACPSGVPYRDLISPFRSHAEKLRRRTLGNRLVRALVQATLPYPRRFRVAALSGRVAKPFSSLLPESLRVMLDLLPDRLPAKQSWLQINPAKGHRRARVALLTGCAQSVLAPDINTATIEVLTHCGVEVVVPQKQVCCGALSWHVGNLAQAQSCAKANVRAFPNDVDAIVTNAAGCGSGMREYHLILKGTEFESQANEFCNRLFDVSAFLDRLGGLPSIPDSGFKKRVAYHDACHLSNSQNVTLAPRRLLQSIPGIEICEIAEPHLCCGSAGTYNIDQPSIARKMGQEKAANIQSLTPDLVATGNIGCMTQLSTHLAKLGTDVPVKHTMQVLRDAYRGCAL